MNRAGMNRAGMNRAGMNRAGMNRAMLAAVPLLTLAAGGFLTFWLVCSAPGYDTDEAELDGRRSASSVEAIRAQHRNQLPVWRGYAQYLASAAHGDLGKSRVWNLSVAELLAERGAVTLRSAGAGLTAGWLIAVALAIAGACRGFTWIASATRSVAASFLCLPAPALALGLCLWGRGSAGFRAAAAVAVMVFARALLTSSAIVTAARAEPHVLQARARGVSGIRLAVTHVLRRASPSLAAVLVAAVPLAFSIAVPVEMVCNLPGAGQLAWLAAQKRDLPVLAGLTMALLALTLLTSAATQRKGAR